MLTERRHAWTIWLAVIAFVLTPVRRSTSSRDRIYPPALAAMQSMKQSGERASSTARSQGRGRVTLTLETERIV